MTVIGLDLGGTKLATAAFSANGEIIYREATRLDGRGGADVAALVAERCRHAIEKMRLIEAPNVDAVGVTVPGIYRSDRGTVWAPNIPGWDDYPLLDELHHALGAQARVVIDSDRAAYILGETWQGAARGARNAIFLAVGTGIGAGILVDGRVLRGHGDIAGAIGWLALDRPFRDAYVSCGCFEHQASGPGLTKVAREMMDVYHAYNGPLRTSEPAELTGEALFAAFDSGDPIAVRTLENAVELWGMASANLVSLFNPETIVFGGGIFGPAIRFLDRIQVEATRWAQPIAIRQVRFVGSALGGDAGLYGAGRLALLVREQGAEPNAALARPSQPIAST